MQNKKFSISDRLKSFQHAFNGLKLILKEEHNFRIHALATFLVIILGFYLDINKSEWIFLILCIALVLCSEAFNTALEHLADALTVEYHPIIKKAKDVAAAATLITAIGALICGGIIFTPKILHLFQ